MRIGRARIGMAVLLLAASPTGGPVEELTFIIQGAGEQHLISWQPPADVADELRYALIYELQERGEGPWKAVHRGPELRLTVLALRAGACTLRVRPHYPDGTTGPWAETDCRVDFDARTATTSPDPCRADAHTACVLDNRFAVAVSWKSQAGSSADALLLPGDGPRRHFSFDQDGHRDVSVSVFDDCRRRDHYGVEVEAADPHEFTVTVADTLAGQTNSFLVPAGTDRAPRARYSEAFATCNR